MSDFKFDEKENYTKDEVKNIIDQHFNYAKNVISKDFENKQGEIKEQITNEVRKQVEYDSFINSVPEKNRELVGALLKDKDMNYVKENYSNLFETIPTKSIVDILDTSGANNTITDSQIYDKVKNDPKNATDKEIGIASEYARMKFRESKKIK